MSLEENFETYLKEKYANKKKNKTQKQMPKLSSWFLKLSLRLGFDARQAWRAITRAINPSRKNSTGLELVRAIYTLFL